jgi:hypothetical protein
MSSRRVTAITSLYASNGRLSISRIGTGTEDSFSAFHIVTQEPTFFLSPGYDKPVEETLDGSLQEATSIDILGYLLDSDDPVVRSTIACSDLEGDFSASRYELKVTFDLSTPGSASGEGADGNNPAILSPTKVLDHDSWSRKPSQRRHRSGRMQPSAAVLPIGSENAMAEEHLAQMSPMASGKTAALRSIKTARKRSCSTVSARLRTTSAGGGM